MLGFVAVVLLLTVAPYCAMSAVTAPHSSLPQALAELKVPPDWMASTLVTWDTARPWAEARLEIRRLLELDDAGVRQGVKLTWLYAQKGDIGDGHELPMYLFMSGNYAWAALEYPKLLKRVAGTGATHAYLCYASCLAHFGGYREALRVLQQATDDLPAPPWRIASLANVHDRYGDLCAATKLVPQQIVEKQSLEVDGVTGATITSQGIVEGAFEALRQAGLP